MSCGQNGLEDTRGQDLPTAETCWDLLRPSETCWDLPPPSSSTLNSVLLSFPFPFRVSSSPRPNPLPSLPLSLSPLSSPSELERIIGQGGFGKVYACRKTSDAGRIPNNKGTWYAIKKLEKDFILKSKTGVESVFVELSSVRDLVHQNICNCHYGFLSVDAVYIVLDIALGGDLRYALKNSTVTDPKSKLKVFDENRMKFYLSQVLDALDYCHEKSILHRDIKPENMLVVTNG